MNLKDIQSSHEKESALITKNGERSYLISALFIFCVIGLGIVWFTTYKQQQTIESLILKTSDTDKDHGININSNNSMDPEEKLLISDIHLMLIRIEEKINIIKQSLKK